MCEYGAQGAGVGVNRLGCGPLSVTEPGLGRDLLNGLGTELAKLMVPLWLAHLPPSAPPLTLWVKRSLDSSSRWVLGQNQPEGPALRLLNLPAS